MSVPGRQEGQYPASLFCIHVIVKEAHGVASPARIFVVLQAFPDRAKALVL
jgi:hypothetical protein